MTETGATVRLAIDARVWRTGIGTYTLGLLSATRQVNSEIWISAIVGKDAAKALANLCDEMRIVDVPIYTLREQFQIPLAARCCDLLHVPHYNIPLLYRGPLVVTIHDLTHVTEPAFRNTGKAWTYARPMLNFAVRRASQVITVSEYSKRDIVGRLGISSEKVSVIYNGVSSQFQPMNKDEARECIRTSLKSDCPYLLYVGNLKPHKNVGTLIQAFARLRSRGSVDHLLVLVGDDRKWKQAVLDECARLDMREAVRHIPWAPEELLPKLYAGADLVVMPSTSEGFGLPVLEAMACGTPVVSSNASSLPEVGGDAVVYFNPRSVEEMADEIERVLSSPSLMSEMREKGLRQAAKFTWEECARRHIEVYRTALTR